MTPPLRGGVPCGNEVKRFGKHGLLPILALLRSIHYVQDDRMGVSDDLLIIK
jgi:hypothetical protein